MKYKINQTFYYNDNISTEGKFKIIKYNNSMYYVCYWFELKTKLVYFKKTTEFSESIIKSWIDFDWLKLIFIDDNIICKKVSK